MAEYFLASEKISYIHYSQYIKMTIRRVFGVCNVPRKYLTDQKESELLQFSQSSTNPQKAESPNFYVNLINHCICVLKLFICNCVNGSET